MGLTSAGFSPKTLLEIKAEIEADERALLGTNVNTSSASVLGQINGIVSAKLREVWELAELVYAAQYPDSASGRSLTLLAALTGTTRNAATKSRVTATVNVDPGAYAAGTLIATVAGDATARFVSIEDAVNSGGSAANVSVIFEAETAGVVRANAGTLTVIAASVSGWNSITNADDATVGEEEETDAQVRLRREAELRASGSSGVDAIRADILRDHVGVISVTVLQNTGDVTDGKGLPPHSIEAIVYGPDPATADDNDALAEILFESVAAGIATHGTTSRTVEDAHGNSHTVKLTRPADVDLYVEIDVSTSAADGWEATSADELAAAVAAWFDDNLGPGDDVIVSRIVALAMAQAGVVDVSEVRIGNTPSPVVTTNYEVGIRSIARISTANITITEV